MSLVERQLPADEEMEAMVLSALMIGHHVVTWAYRSLDVDDFYLGVTGWHGWLFSELQACAKKRLRFEDRLFNRKHLRPAASTRFVLDMWELIELNGEVKSLRKYIERLKEVRIMRDTVLAEARAYCESWKAWDEWLDEHPRLAALKR